MPTELAYGGHRAASLVDVLDRVLDKGLVVAGDVRVSLAEVELLTIRIRLLICSLDKAEQIGMDWWKHDRYFSTHGHDDRALDDANVREQLRALERKVAALTAKGERQTKPVRRRKAS